MASLSLGMIMLPRVANYMPPCYKPCGSWIFVLALTLQSSKDTRENLDLELDSTLGKCYHTSLTVHTLINDIYLVSQQFNITIKEQNYFFLLSNTDFISSLSTLQVCWSRVRTKCNSHRIFTAWKNCFVINTSHQFTSSLHWSMQQRKLNCKLTLL